MTVTAGLLRLYRRTDYVIDPRLQTAIHVAVGRRSADTDALLRRLNRRGGALITAANPRSRTMPEAWNRRMTRNLLDATRRLPSRPAEGRLGRWHEAGVLVCGDRRHLATLGRRFRQNALVLVEGGRRARLLVLAPRRDGGTS